MRQILANQCTICVSLLWHCIQYTHCTCWWYMIFVDYTLYLLIIQITTNQPRFHDFLSDSCVIALSTSIIFVDYTWYLLIIQSTRLASGCCVIFLSTFIIAVDYTSYLLIIHHICWLYIVFVDYTSYLLIIHHVYWLYMIFVDHTLYLLTIHHICLLYIIFVDYTTYTTCVWFFRDFIHYIHSWYKTTIMKHTKHDFT